jgi:hypothetical protein
MNTQLQTPPLKLRYLDIKDPAEEIVQAHEDIIDRTREIAAAFVRRSECVGFKGKKRDELSLEYFIGAATMLRASGQPDHAAYVERLCVLLIATRGYKWVAKFAAEGRFT